MTSALRHSYSASLDNTIKLWDIEQGKCQRTLFGHVEGVWSVDVRLLLALRRACVQDLVQADKLRLVSGSHDRTVKVWDRTTGKCMHTLVGHRGAVTAVSLADDRMITGSDDGVLLSLAFNGVGVDCDAQVTFVSGALVLDSPASLTCTLCYWPRSHSCTFSLHVH